MPAIGKCGVKDNVQFPKSPRVGTAPTLGHPSRSVIIFRRMAAMKKFALIVLLLACFGTTSQAQQHVPRLLFRAAHCLAIKHFLPQSSTGKLPFGYLLDEKSYPGDKIIYVVVFAAPTRSNGTVFAVFLSTKDGRESFNIQNNAGFVLSKREPIGVSFVTPPLGGGWTQEHLASAIKEIEKQPRFTISIKGLSAASSYSCESYTDPQPQPTGNGK